jgi:hypothetical protein
MRSDQMIMATLAAGAVDLYGAVLNEGTTPEADSPGQKEHPRNRRGHERRHCSIPKGMKGTFTRTYRVKVPFMRAPYDR